MPTARMTEFKSVLAATPRIPVVGAPMFLVSGPDLAVAACQAGVIGAFSDAELLHRGRSRRVDARHLIASSLRSSQ
jgi:NAD(P)H-dependent flavin oxidoreductase YrpB (nitropropane dioxygenase family)